MPLTYFKCVDTLLAYCNKSIPANQKNRPFGLNYHIIWTQAVVIRLCEVIRPAHCLTLLSPQRLILIP